MNSIQSLPPRYPLSHGNANRWIIRSQGDICVPPSWGRGQAGCSYSIFVQTREGLLWNNTPPHLSMGWILATLTGLGSWLGVLVYSLTCKLCISMRWEHRGKSILKAEAKVVRKGLPPARAIQERGSVPPEVAVSAPSLEA